MIRNIILALIAAAGLSASAENTTTNLPANTITIGATVDKRDFVTVRGNKLWFTHDEGEYPSDIKVNGNEWSPTWDDEQESDDFTMTQPPRFLPMTGRRGLISVSVAQTNTTVTVVEYPDVVNEWILVILLSNENEGSARMDVTISWQDDPMPVVLPKNSVPHTKPDPTPTGLR